MLDPRIKADPVALAIAQAAQEAAEPAVVILFGSRARGDHHEHSDVDLLVVADDENPRKAEFAAYDGAKSHSEKTGIDLSTNVISMTKEEFRRCRLAKQHIAGQADTQGVIMSREIPDFSMDTPDDDYPDHWPATRQRLQNTGEYSHEFNQMIEEKHWNQRTIGFFAQQAVENALKGWLSAHNDDRNWDHDLNRLWEGGQEKENWATPELQPVYESVIELLDHTGYEDPERPGRESNWLSNYAVIYRYGGTSYRMTQAERLALQEKVNDAVSAIVARIHVISGTTDDDVWPEGVRPWDTTPE